LLEHGLEEQMNKLIRIGIPIFDLSRKFLHNDNSLRNGINDLITDVSEKVFSDYFANNFQKDIMDMHYSGEVHLDALGHWGIGADTIFVDIDQVNKNLNLKSHFPFLPRTTHAHKLNITLPILVSLLQREVSREIVIENIYNIFSDYDIDKISEYFSLSLISSSVSMQYAGSPFITLVLSGNENSERLLQMLGGYLSYIEQVSLPNFGLFITFANSLSNDLLSLLSKIIKSGGRISLSQKSVRSSRGIHKMHPDMGLPIVTLHSLSINLPRLAYQSNKDETYFRTKLALIMRPSVSTLLLKKETLLENIRQDILPALSHTMGFPQLGSTSIIVNLTGLEESIHDILGFSKDEGFDIVKKVVKTANDVLLDFGQHNTDKFGVSIINDSSSTRFVDLDSEKFGKLTHDFRSYSQGLVITKKMLDDEDSLSKNLFELDNLMAGGLYVKLLTSDVSPQEMVTLLQKSIHVIPYFDIFEENRICSICGTRVTRSDVCSTCGSRNIITFN
jgi:ribonucleoside-triphosphate reductase